jgi:hypothetical protein
VRGIKAHPAECAGTDLQLHAYVTWTRHGAFLSDDPADDQVLDASFSEAPQHRESSDRLLKALYASGGAVSTLHGEFQGRLETQGKHVRFELYSGRDLQRDEESN